MPTYWREERFRREYEKLTQEQREAFKLARDQFVRVFQEYEASGRSGIPQFAAWLGVRRLVNHKRIFESRWAGDGRCTWEYGKRVQTGRYHIIWRRIGTHAIYDDP